MPRVVRPEIRDLSFHPGIAILALDVSAHRGHQIAHRPDTAIRGPETESELVSGTHKRPSVWAGHSRPMPLNLLLTYLFLCASPGPALMPEPPNQIKHR